MISLIVISCNDSITTLSINFVEKFEIKFVWCAGYEFELPRRRSGFDPGCVLLFNFVSFLKILYLFLQVDLHLVDSVLTGLIRL